MGGDDTPHHIKSAPAVLSTRQFPLGRLADERAGIERPLRDRRWLAPAERSDAKSEASSSGASRQKDEDREVDVKHFLALALGATGVVFGDIGTSPLYTFSGIFVDVLADSHPSSRDVVDAFSMVFWMLTLVVGVKYVCFVMRVSHHGEGGTFAMMHKILDSVDADGKPVGSGTSAMVTFMAMLGVALMAGDGCITPAISVLSALEGLSSVQGMPFTIGLTAQLALAVVVLLFVFTLQRRGSACIGKVAGPVMVLWFLTIAGLGLYNLASHPEAAQLVMRGLSPASFVNFWTTGHYRGVYAWKSLAGVVLSVTGAEALYADMGHFGAMPISLAWFTLVYPCLILQYMGQAAVLCDNPMGVTSPFYSAVPEQLKWPVVVLATTAAIIASQALISGLFSLLTQAHALHFVPRILVLHTNPDEQGQVYIPEVNWLLCFMCILICVTFQTSGKLAGAYGIAVTSTFLVTTMLLWLVARRVWRWKLLSTLLLIVPMFVGDAALWSANVLKIVESGWVPVVIALLFCLFMHTHLWGRTQEEKVMVKETEEEMKQMQATGTVTDLATMTSIPGLRSVLHSSTVIRTEKAAVFMTPHEWRVPRTLRTLAMNLGCLPRTIVLLSVRFEKVPFVSEADRASFTPMGAGVFSVVLHFGYAEPLTAERLSVQKALAGLAGQHVAAHPGLLPLLELADCSAKCSDKSGHVGDTGSETDDASQSGGDVELGPAQERGSGTPVPFVLHNLTYAAQPDAGHGSWDRFRILLYSFIVLNARKSIAYFGLTGGHTMEISTVRFL